MKVGFVTACTNGKSKAPQVQLGRTRGRLGRHGDDLDRLFGTWTTALDDADPREALPAVDLYSGVAWAASRDLLTALRALGVEVHAWILSAGYGLVAWDEPLIPYTATFSPGKRDSIAPNDGTKGRAANRSWWNRLLRWSPRGHQGPRSFEEMSQGLDAFFVVMSSRYLDAAGDDLLRGMAGVTSAVIVSGGLRDSHPAAAYAVPVDKRLREPASVTGAPALVSASDMSLNQRVAEHLLLSLGEDALYRERAATYLQAAIAERKPARTYAHRRAATDDEIVDFLTASLLEDSNTTKTALLRAWRCHGRQCEQKRFGRLFEQAKSDLQLAGLATE